MESRESSPNAHAQAEVAAWWDWEQGLGEQTVFEPPLGLWLAVWVQESYVTTLDL